MTFDVQSAAFAADLDIAVEPRPERPQTLPAHADVADPEPGWATRNPDKAMVFLFVSPRDCEAVDELLAL
jgi:hypothetical protein